MSVSFDNPAVSAADFAVRLSDDGPLLLPATTAEFRAGQVTALMGASGSGKTTLLRALIGHLPPGAVATGALQVLGHTPHLLPAERLRLLRRKEVAYVGQDPGAALNPRMTVRRLVAELAVDQGEESVLGVLAECRLPGEGIADRRPGALSGGQQRRVALARALARGPAVLVLDEPTAGLDAVVRDEVGALLRELAVGRGLAVVVATHDPEFVEGCADRVVRLGAVTGVSGKGVGGVLAGDGVAGARLVDDVSAVGELVAAPSAGRNPAATTSAGRNLASTPSAGRTPDADPSAHDRITAQALDAHFPTARHHHPVLTGIDFTAAPGSAAAVIGPSGSGKTTLLRVLAGLHPTHTGRLALDGTPLPARVQRRTRDQQRRIQLIPQDPLSTLNPRHTVARQLDRPLRLHTGLPKDARHDRVAELLTQVGLPVDLAERHPAELSGGQRQRVSIARALAAGPDVLLCDEITSALDTETATGIMDLLTRLRTEHRMTLVVVSHEHHLIARHTDTVHLLEAGRLTDSGPTARLLPI